MLFTNTFPTKKSTAPVPAPGLCPVALGGPAPREGGDLLASGPASVNWCRAPMGLPQVEFYRFFDDPKRRRTNNDFSNLQKSTEMSESIGPGLADALAGQSKSLVFSVGKTLLTHC